MTDDEKWAELVDAVIAVADAARPWRRSSAAAKVPWTRIHRLRAALDAAGIEWRPGPTQGKARAS